MESNKQISIIVPAFKEEGNVQTFLNCTEIVLSNASIENYSLKAVQMFYKDTKAAEFQL